MTSRRLLSRAFLGATALAATALPAPALAQRIDRIVAFGDSYVDQDNALQLGLIPANLQPLYPTGRFTGGTNYIDTLSTLLGAPVVNFAIGGAKANPEFLFEVNSFMAGGGGPAFPTVTPTFQEGDLLAINIGANDARAYASTAGASVAGAPAAAAPTIGAITTGLNTLVGAGAPTISYMAGDAGRLPEVAANPSVAAIRSAFSASVNQSMQGVLAGYAADGVIVHYLDLNAVLDRVSNNLSAFGLTGLTCPPFTVSTQCVVTGGAGFLFYGDLLHPTSQGSAILAQYVAAQLQAPLTLQAPSELGLDTARQFGRTLSSRVDLGSPRDGDLAEGVRFFLAGDAFSRDTEESSSTDAFDIDGVGLTAGLAYGFGNGTVGVAANVSRPRARFGADVSSTKSGSVQVGAFAGYAIAGAFAQGYLGFGKDDHGVSRFGVIDELSADADGSHWLAGAKGGYLLPLGVMRAGPVVALDYAKAKVDGYTEDGDAALALHVSSVSAKSLTGGIGAEMRGDFETGGMHVRPYLSAMIEKELLDGARSVRFAQTSAPGIVNRWEFDERSKSPYGRVSFGGSAGILTNVSLNAVGSATLGRDDGNEVSAQVGLNVGF